MAANDWKTGLMALVLSAQGCLCVNADLRAQSSSLRDLNGDGKPDFVYCVTEDHGMVPFEEKKVYKLFWKENQGEGKFSEEKLLFETNQQPNDYCR